MKVLPNGVAVIEDDTHHAVWCAQEGLVHDLFTANIIRKVFARHRVTCALDIGANIGTLTRVMLDAGAQVHAFECNPAALDCLRYNCPQAKVYPKAVYDRHCKLPFYPLENAGASYVGPKARTWLPSDVDTDILAVDAVPLDSYSISPGFIKLDIEGFETRALVGAQNMIDAYAPVILCEVNKGALDRAGSSDEELRDTLNRFGYQQEIIQPDCRWGDAQFDVLCIPS